MEPTKKKGRADEFDVEIGKRLKQFRTEKGWSQERLARAVGVTFQQIQKQEWGVNRISASRLYRIAKALKIQVSDFFPQEKDASIMESVIKENAHLKERIAFIGKACIGISNGRSMNEVQP